MIYELSGPYELPRGANRLFTSDAKQKRAFWEQVEEEWEGLSDAHGCYLFSGRGKIWYVGKAEKLSFRQECFSPDKINKINEAGMKAKGPISLMLIPRLTPKGRFAKSGQNGISGVNELELLLIGAAIERNSELLNKASTRALKETCVPGFLNSKRGWGRRRDVQVFKKIMGL